MLTPELVAPAGTYKKLKIALAYGADAVYAGLNNFSLRSRTSRGFDYESFGEAIKYTHDRGKKLYVTVNGFHFSSQLEGFKRHILRLKELGPDAFITASIGACKIVRDLAPEVALHVSTQANVLNYEDALVYKDMGAKRVVIARELGLKDAKAIHEKAGIELEAFVHGAMCFAYSGRCLISSLQSGRMSNKGSCANDCRFPYELYAKDKDHSTLFRIEQREEGTHIFNSKDLMLVEYVEKIMQENCVGAFKIEGRTKSEYYACMAVKAYRAAIDDTLKGCFNPRLYESWLNTLSNRGFSSGYLVKRPFERDDMQNFETSFVPGSSSPVALYDDTQTLSIKGKLELNKPYELILPQGETLANESNEKGELFLKDGKQMILFKELRSSDGRVFSELHSGNTAKLLAPFALPEFSFIIG